MIRHIQGSTVIYLILFIILIFFIILLIVYLLATPVDRTTSAIKYPYILSVKPALLGKGSSAQIFLSSSLTIDPKKIDMFVVSPDGIRYPGTPNQTKNNIVTWNFPKDFLTTSNMIGNYTLVLITGASNQNLTSLSLYVVDNPFLYSLSNFLLGKGVGIAVGIIIPIVTISYQMLSQQNQDLARRRDDKADWMMKNMNYYLTLSADSGVIYARFEKGKELRAEEPDYKKIDPENILINTIKFYRDYMEFGKNTGVYFFDDFRVEDFVAQLDARIFDLTSNMLQDKYTTLSQFYDLKSEVELKNNAEFKSYLQKVNNWLLEPVNSRSLFRSHYVYSWVLQVAVNKTLLLTYSPMSFSKKVKSRQLTDYQVNLNRFLEQLNELFYEKKTDLYYEMFDNKGNLQI